ncbi:hypothetical protein VNI00_006112 [Paramarasmius palmivorus]|uniref:Uncharacterized protein n=1 Tax=Paramarasmius palmivorus TaxID=297713 RepID=A0AAW0D904_9AGAR
MIGAEESPDVEEHEDVYTSSVQGLPSTLPAATPWPSITGGVRPSTSVHRRSNKLNQRPTVVKGLGGMLGSEKLEDRGRPVIPVVSGLGAVPVAVDTVRPPMRDVIRSGEKDREMDKLVGDGNNTTIAQKFGDESLTHQYYRELYLSRTEDNPECRLSHAEKLQLLRQREQSWINCQPDFTKLVPINFDLGRLYDLSAGVYILGDATRHRLKYLMLPSRPQDSMEWLTFEPKVTYWKDQGYIIDFAINLYEHDLIALITANLCMIDLSIYEFSTGRFHPLAKQTVIPITRSEIQWGTPSINCEIVGEHLALVTTFWRNPLSRCTVYVYQWRTGKQLLHIDGEPDTYRGIIFLSEHFILLPNKANNTLEIWRIPPSSEGPPTFPVRVLSLPVLNPGYLLRNIVCRSEPNPTASGATLKSDKPFHPSPKESIVLLRLHIHGQTGIALITVFVHRSSLLNLVKMDNDEREQRLAAGKCCMRDPVPWPVWAPPVAYCMGNLPLRWITTTCGQRFVMLSPDDVELDVFGNREPAPLVVYDFGKGSVKKVESEYERLSLEDKLRYNGPVVRRAMSLPEESAKIFADPIESYLPFVETRTEQTYGFDGALMDDERIIGIKASLFGDVTSVEVLHFG